MTFTEHRRWEKGVFILLVYNTYTRLREKLEKRKNVVYNTYTTVTDYFCWAASIKACCGSSTRFASTELGPTVKVLEVPVKGIIWPVKPFLKSPKYTIRYVPVDASDSMSQVMVTSLKPKNCCRHEWMYKGKRKEAALRHWSAASGT